MSDNIPSAATNRIKWTVIDETGCDVLFGTELRHGFIRTEYGMVSGGVTAYRTVLMTETGTVISVSGPHFLR